MNIKNKIIDFIMQFKLFQVNLQDKLYWFCSKTPPQNKGSAYYY